MIFLERYIHQLHIESLPDLSQRKQNSNEATILYFKMHLELSLKYNQRHQLFLFLNILKTKRKDLGLKIDDIYKIFHNTEINKTFSYLDYANQNNDKTAFMLSREEWKKFDNDYNSEINKTSSYLNYANQNRDKTAALLILECEKKVHCNDQSALKRCIRENLVNDELKVWLKEQCKKNIDNDCLKDTFGINKHGKPWIIFSLTIESLIFSILPYLWDQVSDIRLYQTYSSMGNNSLFGNLTTYSFSNTTIKIEDNNSSAALITLWILVMNGLFYLIGSILCSPTWLHAAFWNGHGFSYSQMILHCFSSNRFGIYQKCLLHLYILISRLLWPLLVLIPHQYIHQTSKIPRNDSMDKYKSENLWLFIKVIESSVENVLQTALQVWLLIPIFGLISKWTLGELILSGSKGALNIISFGIYQPETLDIVIGKIMFTVILLSFSHSWMKLKKQGLGLIAKLKSLPLLFTSTILQVSSRIFVLRNLMIMTVSAEKKYTLFLIVHFLSLLIIKIVFETRKKQKLKNYGTEEGLNQINKAKSSVYYHLKRPVLLVVSCLSSTLVMVDLHWISSKLHYPKHNFISQCLFFLLILVENLIMTLLPFLIPSLFPSASEFNHDSFSNALVFVNVTWIISVCLEVIIILI